MRWTGWRGIMELGDNMGFLIAGLIGLASAALIYWGIKGYFALRHRLRLRIFNRTDKISMSCLK